MFLTIKHERAFNSCKGASNMGAALTTWWIYIQETYIKLVNGYLSATETVCNAMDAKRSLSWVISTTGTSVNCLCLRGYL